MISEILELVNKASTKEEKVQVLKKYDTPALRHVLKYALHDKITFYREDLPPYKKDDSPEELSFSSLYNEYKKLYIFLNEVLERQTTQKVTSFNRKNQILISMLESIHRKDSDLLSSMIDGTFKQKYKINAKLAEEAFPGLLK